MQDVVQLGNLCHLAQQGNLCRLAKQGRANRRVQGIGDVARTQI